MIDEESKGMEIGADFWKLTGLKNGRPTLFVITQKLRNRFFRQIASNQSSDELSRTDMPAIHNLARVRRVLIAHQFLKESKHTHVLLLAEEAEAPRHVRKWIIVTKFLFVSKKGQKSQKDNCRLPSHSINQKISNLMHRTILSPTFDQ